MSDWTLNGAPIVTGTLTVPRVGAWVLDAIAVSDDPIEGPVELAVGASAWSGAVLRGGVAEGRWRGRVVGGAGGLSRTVTARQYRSVTRRLIVAATLAEVGEGLDADAEGLDALLTTWVRLAEPAAVALARLVATWRALPSGAITSTPWPVVDAPDLEVVLPLPEERAEVFAVEGLDVMPGMLRDGRAVAGVTFSLDGAVMRARVTYDA